MELREILEKTIGANVNIEIFSREEELVAWYRDGMGMHTWHGKDIRECEVEFIRANGVSCIEITIDAAFTDEEMREYIDEAEADGARFEYVRLVEW